MKNVLYIFLMVAICQLNAQAASDPVMSAPEFSLGDFFKKKVNLPAGTLVLLETAEKMETDQATVGKLLQFKVRMNVMAENEIAISSGALAVGRIKNLSAATYNSATEVTIELLYVQAVDGQMVPLNGNEQTIRGLNPGEGTSIEPGAHITAQVMNTIEIKTN